MTTPRKPTLSLVERRRAPRFSVDFPCKAVTEQGDAAQGRVRDISLSGLQLMGNHDFIQTLHPNFKRADWRAPLKIAVHFSLPTATKSHAHIELLCQLVYCKRSAESVYKVGCQYLEIPIDAQVALQDYITHFGKPKD